MHSSDLIRGYQQKLVRNLQSPNWLIHFKRQIPTVPEQSLQQKGHVSSSLLRRLWLFKCSLQSEGTKTG